VGSAGEAVKKNECFWVLKSTQKAFKYFLKRKTQTKLTTGGSREKYNNS
jgi:hypothetical protein